MIPSSFFSFEEHVPFNHLSHTQKRKLGFTLKFENTFSHFKHKRIFFQKSVVPFKIKGKIKMRYPIPNSKWNFQHTSWNSQREISKCGVLSQTQEKRTLPYIPNSDTTKEGNTALLPSLTLLNTAVPSEHKTRRLDFYHGVIVDGAPHGSQVRLAEGQWTSQYEQVALKDVFCKPIHTTVLPWTDSKHIFAIVNPLNNKGVYQRQGRMGCDLLMISIWLIGGSYCRGGVLCLRQWQWTV